MGSASPVTVAIIGGGAVGVATLHHLVHELTGATPVRIVMFDRSPDIGPGQAYSEDNQDQLLNRVASTMSAIHGEERRFHEWCLDNADTLRRDFPQLRFDAGLQDDYVPRRLFGRHVASLLKAAQAAAQRKKIQVDLLCDEVTSLHPRLGAYSVCCASGSMLTAQHAVLAIGNHTVDHYPGLSGRDRYLPSPYPASRLTRCIPAQATVAILGSRLSAVDAAIALSAAGHQGRLYICSRSGMLPSVKSTQVDDSPRQFWEGVGRELRARPAPTSLRKIRDLIASEVGRLTGSPGKIHQWFRRPRDASSYLRHELTSAGGKEQRAWQSVLSAMNVAVEILWHRLPQRERKFFRTVMQSKWMSLRVGMPEQSARRLLALIEGGQLEVVRSITNVSACETTKSFSISTRDTHDAMKADFVVNATGSTDDLERIESRLLRQMLADKVIRQHPLGGIDVSFDDASVIDGNGGKHPHFYAIGTLTSGTYFFTSVLELNVKHAHRIARAIASSTLALHGIADKASGQAMT